MLSSMPHTISYQHKIDIQQTRRKSMLHVHYAQYCIFVFQPVNCILDAQLAAMTLGSVVMSHMAPV